ncbi:DUF6538 domain-containing protein [Thalassolituus oleivorans]|nr:DUF6538 domain-containing protein [Thalassolituus oleivorans]
MSQMPSPFKHPKTSIYYLRVRIPVDLKSAYAPTSEVKKSLKTKDLSLAKARFAVAYAKLQEEFSIKRLTGTEKTPKSVTTNKMTLRDIGILADRWLQDELTETRRSMSFDHLHAADSDKYLSYHEAIVIPAWEKDQEHLTGLIRVLGDSIDRTLENSNVVLDRADPLYITLVRVVTEKSAELARITYDNVSVFGNNNTPQPSRNRLSTEIATISTAFDRYKMAQVAAKTDTNKIQDYEPSVNMLIALIGDLDAREVKKRDISEYMDFLHQLPTRPPKAIKSLPPQEQAQIAREQGLSTLSPTTVSNKVKHLSAFFAWCVEREYIAENPCTSIKKPKRKPSNSIENDYTKEELEEIFKLPMFTNGEEPLRADFGAAWFWLPILAYYTGARPKELAQLYRKDLMQSEGIHFIAIRDIESDQTLKTPAAQRKIPIHDDLIKLGFIRYIESLSATSRVFPHLKPDSRGSYSYHLSRRFSERLKTLNEALQRKKPLYALRHAFKTSMRDAGVSEDVHDSITGHSGPSVGRQYGKTSIEATKKAIDLVPSIPNIEAMLRYRKSQGLC